MWRIAFGVVLWAGSARCDALLGEASWRAMGELVSGETLARDLVVATAMGAVTSHDGLWQVPVSLRDSDAMELAGRFLVRQSDGAIAGFTAPRRRLVPSRDCGPLMAQDVAERLARLLAPQFHQAPYRVLAASDQQLRPDRSGCYYVSFAVRRGALHLPWGVNVFVQCWDGRVAAYRLHDEPIAVATEPLLTAEQAFETARMHLAKSGYRMEQLSAAEPPRLCIGSTPGDQSRTQRLYWSLAVDAVLIADPSAGLDRLHVDALSGGLLWRREAPRIELTQEQVDQIRDQDRAVRSGEFVASDGWPSWLSSPGRTLRVVFAGVRSRHGVPRQRARYPALFLAGDGDQAIACLIQKDGLPARSPTAAGSVVVAELHRSVGSVDVDAGVACSLGGAEDAVSQGGSQPNLSRDATRLAVADRRTSGSQDIYVGDVLAGSLRHQRCVARLAGDESLPTFSADGAWLFFAHRSPIDTTPGAALYRVRPDRWYDDGNPPPEKLADVPGVVGRLSAFPDNRRLLVWHSKGLDVLDVETRKLTPLGLPELHDPDLPDGKPLVVQEPAVSPDGQQIAFSAVRWSGKPEDPSGQYIYVCNLDGSGLKRITPLEDVVVPPYIFPATGKPAFEVPVEYAKPYVMP